MTGGDGKLQSMMVLVHPASSEPVMVHDDAKLVSLGV